MDDLPSQRDFDVLNVCDYCLNPISFVERRTRVPWTRFHIFVLGKYICSECAHIVGILPNFIWLMRDRTQIVSRN